MGRKKKKPEGYTISGFRHELDCHGKPIEIIALADLHIGDPHSDEKLIHELVTDIKNNENRYCVLCGDLMNTAIMNSKSDTYSEVMRPSEQLEYCYQLLSPIKDKILAIVPGNHEERITRSVGADMTRMLARELGLQDVYSDTTALVFLHFGCSKRHGVPLAYSLYITHGTGGGRGVGGSFNGLHNLASIIDADVIVQGHTHKAGAFKEVSFRVVPQHTCAVEHERLLVNTGAALNYGGYGRRGGFQPTSKSYPVIVLDNRVHKATAHT